MSTRKQKKKENPQINAIQRKTKKDKINESQGCKTKEARLKVHESRGRSRKGDTHVGYQQGLIAKI